MTLKSGQTITLALGLAWSAVAASTVARADDSGSYTLEEVQACSGDAMRFCQDALPDVHKIETCMQAKKAQLSKACQAMFDPKHKR